MDDRRLSYKWVGLLRSLYPGGVLIMDFRVQRTRGYALSKKARLNFRHQEVEVLVGIGKELLKKDEYLAKLWPLNSLPPRAFKYNNMSYRDMRLFCETMKSLGYHRLISIENFRRPNFPLVAEILRWLVERYGGGSQLNNSASPLDTEQDRIIFIKLTVKHLAEQTGIWLHPKRLYQADGFAVRELLKLTRQQYEAAKSTNVDHDTSAGQEVIADTATTGSLLVSELFDLPKAKQIQHGRALASELSSLGSSIHSLLEREPASHEARANAIKQSIDRDHVTEWLNGVLGKLRDDVDQAKAGLARANEDLQGSQSKLEAKQRDLDRQRKRLATLQSVRPAYMTEYEQLEEELASLYSTYLTRFRNLAYLERQLHKHQRFKVAEEEDGDEESESQFAGAGDVDDLEDDDEVAIKPGLVIQGGVGRYQRQHNQSKFGPGRLDRPKAAATNRLNGRHRDKMGARGLEDDDDLSSTEDDDNEEELGEEQERDSDDLDASDVDAVDYSLEVGDGLGCYDDEIGRLGDPDLAIFGSHLGAGGNQLIPGWSPQQQRLNLAEPPSSDRFLFASGNADDVNDIDGSLPPPPPPSQQLRRSSGIHARRYDALGASSSGGGGHSMSLGPSSLDPSAQRALATRTANLGTRNVLLEDGGDEELLSDDDDGF